jgi:TonB-dependent starch-binding outer membrane protein SusC
MKQLLLTVAMVLCAFATAMAQRSIVGKITDEQGEGLIGATITVPNTNVGAVTDVDGNFRLEIPSGATALKIIYTGFITQEVPLTNANVYNIQLQSDLAALEEVVVVGYGTQQRRAITGTVSTIKMEDVNAQQVQSFDQMLQGRAAGVNINIPNGVLNNPPVIRIRGANSINLSSFPLVVIDGIPTFTGDATAGANSAANNPLSNLNPADIESIEILKDASASAIYGSRASAGVLLITTKRGKKGKTRITYDGSLGWTQPTRLPELLDARQYVDIKNEAARNANLVGQQFFLDTINGQEVNTNWYDYAYQNAMSQNHNMSFSGGTEQTTYYVSLNVSDQNGMIVKNKFQRLAGRVNLDHTVNKYLKAGAILGYSTNNNQAPNTGSLEGQAFNTSGLARLPLVTSPNVSPYKADGSYNIDATNQVVRGKNRQQVSFANMVPIIDLNRFISRSSQIQSSAYLQVTPFKGLALRTQYGIDRLALETESYQTPIHGDGFSTNGLAENRVRNLNRWNWQNTLSYDVTLAEKNNINVLVGHEEQYTTDNRWGAQRTQVADPFFTTYQGNFTTINPAGSFQGENYLLSYFGRLNYDFNRTFLFSVNARQDEYSAFAPGEKRGIFWGGSAGIAISEMQWWKDLMGNKFNYFKIRGSYGVVGNNNGINDFAWQSLYNSGLYGPASTIFYSQAGNSQLTWETSKKTDIGVVFGLLNDRLQGEYTYFVNDIDGLILDKPQAPSKGIPDNSIATNVGAMRNTGHEIGLTFTPVKTRNFTWESNFNVTFTRNEILDLDGDLNTNNPGELIQTATSGLETVSAARVGQSLGEFFLVETRGVNPANGRRVFVRVDSRDANGVPINTTLVQYQHVVAAGQSRWTTLDGQNSRAVGVSTDGQYFGPALPLWFGGWDNTFRFKNIDLNVQCNYSGGNYIYNGTKAGLRDQRFWNNHTDLLDRWTENNTDGTVPRVVFGDNVSNGSGLAMSENVEKGDFFRIRNITLGYNLPASLLNKAKIANIRVYANMNNWFLFTNYTGTDPEVSTNGNIARAPGIDRNTAPMAKSILFGINVGF